MFGNDKRRIEELEAQVATLKAQIEGTGKVGTMHWKGNMLISAEGRLIGSIWETSYRGAHWAARFEGDDQVLGEYISRGAAVTALETVFDSMKSGKLIPQRRGGKTVYVSSGSNGNSGLGMGSGLLIGLVAGSMLSHHDHQAPAASGESDASIDASSDVGASDYDSSSTDSGSDAGSDSGSSGGDSGASSVSE